MKKSKVTIDSLIHLELSKLERKVKEFQSYLELNPINASVTKGGDVLLSEDAQDKLHKEIVIQIKMQDALFNWLPLLEKLKAKESEKKPETRGDIEIGDFFNK